jgi:hypothetical protein
MAPKMKHLLLRRDFQILLLCLVLLVGVCLRSVGLSWGLDRGYHPDELKGMHAVAELDLLAGDLTAPSAYYEGTFNYYLWSLPISVIEHWEKPSKKLRASTAYYVRNLLIGRAMTVLFDTLAILLIFLAGMEAINAFYPALFGAFLYTVIPMQVIYAHFLRTHILSNLLCALVFWLSFKLIRRREWWLLLITGVVSGLGAATHYPVGIIAVIPCLCLLFDPARASLSRARALWEGVRYLLSGPLWWIGLGFAIGVFVGEPILFFDPHSIVLQFSEQNLRFVPSGQFGMKSLINFTAIWKYLRTLIPYAMWPLAWIIPYLAIIYLLIRMKFVGYVVPILLFSLLYLYPMAKGYYNAVFARAAMLLFPGFCILASLVCYDVLQLIHLRTAARRSIVAALFLLMLPSLAFDCAYVRAMQRTDPRSAFRAEIRKMAGASVVQVGVQKSGGYFYTVTPAIKTVGNPKIRVRAQQPNEPADYYVVGFTGPTRPPQMQKAIELVQSGEKFKFIKQYRAQPRLFGHKLDLSSFPTDMTYPFPEILLFRSTDSLPVVR